MAKTTAQAATQADAAAKAPAVVYTKGQLAASKKYANRRDLISVLLEDGKAYTLEETDKLIEEFMKGEVN